MRSIEVPGRVAAGLADARERLDAVAEDAAAGALRGAALAELTATVQTVRAMQAELESMLLVAVREVDARCAHRDDGALSTAAWLRMRARMAPGEASSCVRTARALAEPELAATAAALRAGDIDAAHAREIARGAAEAPPGAIELIEAEVLEVARTADRRAVAGVMAQFAHALDPDRGDAAALRRLERRGLSAAPTLDGMLAGSFLADAATGSLILTAIDAADPLVTGDTRTPAQRRLDAFGAICSRFLGSPDAPMSGGGHAHVVVTVDAETVAADHNQDGHDTQDDGGNQDDGGGPPGSPGASLSWIGHIPGSTARRIACDADITTVAIDPDGHVHGVAREQRFFNWAQRLAMIARDGDRCPVPWCDRPITWSDGHHIRAWTAGGPTTIDNGALPCAAHHTMLHEGHWTLHRLPDGRYAISHPDGRVIGPEPHPPGHNRPPPRQRE